MSVSDMWRLSSAFTDTSIVKAYRDGIIDTGTQFLFDTTLRTGETAPYSLNGLSANANVPSGATLLNLVDGSSSATCNTSSSHIADLTGFAGFSFDGAGGSSNIALGTAGSFNLASSNHEFIVWYWIKVAASGYLTSNFLAPFYNTTGNANAAQWWFDLGTGGLQPRFVIGEGGSSSYNVNATSNMTAGSIYCIAGHWKPGALIEIYVNGVVSGSSSVSVPTTLQSASSVWPTISNQQKMTIYRWGLEDLTTSGVAAATQAAAEYSQNSSRFT